MATKKSRRRSVKENRKTHAIARQEDTQAKTDEQTTRARADVSTISTEPLPTAPRLRRWWHRGPWRRLISGALIAIPVIAMLFGGIQTYYSHYRHRIDVAERAGSAEELLRQSLQLLLPAVGRTPPLQGVVAVEVEEARRAIAQARSMGGDARLSSELSAISDALQLHADDAIKRATDLRQQAPDRLLPYLALGISYFDQSQFAKSAMILTAALEKFPTSAELLTLRARALLRQRNIDEAGRDAERAVARDPAQAAAHFSLGLVLTARGLDEEATDAFATAAKLAPDWHEPHVAIASIYIHDKKFVEALTHLDLAVANAPDDATAWLTRSGVHEALGDSGPASASLTRAKELSPATFIQNIGYTRVAEWPTDLPKLDEFNGDFLLAFRDSHRGYRLEGFELPLLRALGGTTSVAKFLRFEEALFDICVEPDYHIKDLTFGSAQMMRLMNRTPECLLRKNSVTTIWMTEAELHLAPNEIPWRPMPKVESARINAFLAQRQR